jgi:hypothetical protein
MAKEQSYLCGDRWLSVDRYPKPVWTTAGKSKCVPMSQSGDRDAELARLLQDGRELLLTI